jgi:hypothetical protein
MPAVTIEHTTDEAIVFMFWHDVYVAWVKGSATVANQIESYRHIKKVSELWPRGVATMVVIGPTAGPVSDDVRKEQDKIYRDFGSRMRCMAYVILGTGFQASVARATLMTMNLLTRRPYPTSVHSDVSKGAEWLFSHLVQDTQRGTVEQFTQALTAAVRGEAPTTLRTQK